MSSRTPPSDREAFFVRWQAAGPLLAAQKVAEIRQMSLLDRQQQIENLLNLAYEFRRDRIDDGLVRWQQVMRLLDQAQSRRS